MQVCLELVRQRLISHFNKLHCRPLTGEGSIRPMAFSLTLVSLLSMSPTVAVAQTVGVRVGLTRSTLSSGGSNTGFTLGSDLTFELNQYFSLQPALAYSEKGGARGLFGSIEDGGRVFVESQLKVKLGYINLPVLATLHVPLVTRLGLRFAAGPSVSFLVRCTGRIQTRRTDLLTGQQLPDTDEGPQECPDFQNTDIGLVLGGGVDLAVASTTLTADVRYNLGLRDIAVGEAEIKNRVLAVTLGVVFRP